jgi:hypothetical protein
MGQSSLALDICRDQKSIIIDLDMSSKVYFIHRSRYTHTTPTSSYTYNTDIILVALWQ